jgi:hypothetical protein
MSKQRRTIVADDRRVLFVGVNASLYLRKNSKEESPKSKILMTGILRDQPLTSCNKSCTCSHAQYLVVLVRDFHLPIGYGYSVQSGKPREHTFYGLGNHTGLSFSTKKLSGL